MKKIYIKPQAKTIILDASEILAGSDVSYGGSNKAAGAPTAAESKGMFDDDDWD